MFFFSNYIFLTAFDYELRIFLLCNELLIQKIVDMRFSCQELCHMLNYVNIPFLCVHEPDPPTKQEEQQYD